MRYIVRSRYARNEPIGYVEARDITSAKEKLSLWLSDPHDRRSVQIYEPTVHSVEEMDEKADPSACELAWDMPVHSRSDVARQLIGLDPIAKSLKVLHVFNIARLEED